jgi:hypothetical protein
MLKALHEERHDRRVLNASVRHDSSRLDDIVRIGEKFQEPSVMYRSPVLNLEYRPKFLLPLARFVGGDFLSVQGYYGGKEEEREG